MSYWQMDDKFLGHHKTVRALRAGADALLMWVALRSYVANNESDGFIPDEDIDDLPGAPKEPRRWLKVLVECGKPLGGGARGAGLVDATPDGWMLHNYAKRGLLRQQIESAREAARTRKERWRERHGTPEERRSEPVPNASGTSPRARAPAGALPSSPILSHPTEGTERPREVAPVVITSGRRQDLSFQMASPEDVEVFDAWQELFQMTDSKFTADRAIPLRDRRAEDMTQQDALDALAGAATDDWFIRQGRKLKLVFNDRERFETYRNVGRGIRAGRPPPNAKAPPPRRGNAPLQGSHGQTGFEGTDQR